MTADDQQQHASTNAADGNHPSTSSGPATDPPPSKRAKLDPPPLIPLAFGAAEDKGHRTALEDVWVVHTDARPPDTSVRHATTLSTRAAPTDQSPQARHVRCI